MPTDSSFRQQHPEVNAKINEKSKHLSEESSRLITCLNNYSVQIAPEHSPLSDKDGIVWRSSWPTYIDGVGIDSLLKHIGFIE